MMVGQPNVGNLDIYRSANVPIREHGEDSPAHASKRHDTLAEASDDDGCAVWKQIIRAIEELLSREPSAGAGVH